MILISYDMIARDDKFAGSVSELFVHLEFGSSSDVREPGPGVRHDNNIQRGEAGEVTRLQPLRGLGTHQLCKGCVSNKTQN